MTIAMCDNSLMSTYLKYVYYTVPSRPDYRPDPCIYIYIRHNSFSKPSFALPTSQLIFQPFLLLYLCHSSFSNPSFASPTSQALHLRHLASMPSDESIITCKLHS